MYFVAGATGHTGSVVVQTLLDRGAKVRVLARSPEKLSGLRDRGVEVVRGDLSDGARLREALSGVQGAYLLLPPNVTSERVLADNAARSATMTEAVQTAKVPHVVALSSIGAQHESGTGPIRSLHRLERDLAGKTAVTAIRAAYFMENWAASLGGLAHGVLPTFLQSDVAIPMVSTRDIGRVAAEALLAGGKGSEILELEGPKPYAPRDAATILGALTGREIALEEGPPDAIVPTFQSFGMSKDMAELYRELIVGIHRGIVAFSGEGRRVKGAVSLDDVLRSLLQSTN